MGSSFGAYYPLAPRPGLAEVSTLPRGRLTYLLTYLLTDLLSHSRGTPLSHLHCPVGQLRSHVVLLQDMAS